MTHKNFDILFVKSYLKHVFSEIFRRKKRGPNGFKLHRRTTVSQCTPFNFNFIYRFSGDNYLLHRHRILIAATGGGSHGQNSLLSHYSLSSSPFKVILLRNSLSLLQTFSFRPCYGAWPTLLFFIQDQHEPQSRYCWPP